LKHGLRLAALIVGCLVVLFGALLLTGAPPAQTIKDFILGSVGSLDALGGTLQEMTPLLILGAGVFLALRAGLFNIGIDGQFTVGACAAAAVALKVPGFFGTILAVIAAIAAGALWALPAGLIKAYKGGHEVITTIMLNNVAVLLTGYLVSGPLMAAKADAPMSEELKASSYLPDILHTEVWRVSSALLIGVVIVVALAWWLKKTVAGYELQAAGANPTAAEFAGVNAKRVIVRAMAASGAIGGLAGAFQVLAFTHQFYEHYSPGYGFDALGVALLAAGSPLMLVPGAFFFGMLSKGGTFISISGVPKGMTYIVLGLLILVTAAIRYRKVKAHD
jgi:general nucleoside transport system permease protein